MKWAKNRIITENGWYLVGIAESASGTSIGVLAAPGNTGSPHAHLVQFNEVIIYVRQTHGLSVDFSDGTINLHKVHAPSEILVSNQTQASPLTGLQHSGTQFSLGSHS